MFTWIPAHRNRARKQQAVTGLAGKARIPRSITITRARRDSQSQMANWQGLGLQIDLDYDYDGENEEGFGDDESRFQC